MRERYIFTGTLICKTGLHVGSGRGSERTDSTVMTDHAGKPFIPGSSLKGAMRSTVERMVYTLKSAGGGNVDGCILFDDQSHDHCVSVNKEAQKDYENLREGGATEATLLEFLFGDVAQQKPRHLCDVCNVFGSPYYASKVRITDACAINWPTERDPDVRDGVGIDRDTETARENIKFDFEVVQPKTKFQFEMMVEDPDCKDLGLVCLALRELELEGIRLGGIKSRGLGKVQLKLNDQVTKVNFVDPANLLNYLLNKKGEPLETTQFVDEQLKRLLQ